MRFKSIYLLFCNLRLVIDGSTVTATAVQPRKISQPIFRTLLRIVTTTTYLSGVVVIGRSVARWNKTSCMDTDYYIGHSI